MTIDHHHNYHDIHDEVMTMLISGISKGPDGAKASRRKVEAQLFNLVNADNDQDQFTMTMTFTTWHGIQCRKSPPHHDMVMSTCSKDRMEEEVSSWGVGGPDTSVKRSCTWLIIFFGVIFSDYDDDNCTFMMTTSMMIFEVDDIDGSEIENARIVILMMVTMTMMVFFPTEIISKFIVLGFQRYVKTSVLRWSEVQALLRSSHQVNLVWQVVLSGSFSGLCC